MKFITLCAIVSAGLPTTLRANLGDTQTEIHKHYGKPISIPVSMTNQDLTETFVYKQFVIEVTFIGGQCQRENYKKKNKGGFTEQEIQALLDSNANGHTWSLMNDTDKVKIWVQDSKEAFAGYYKTDPYLSLETVVMLQFTNTVKAMMEKAREHPQAPPPPPPQQNVPQSLKP